MLDELFRYRIGGFVTPRFPLHYKTYDYDGKVVTPRLKRLPMIVVSRILEECPGGVQKHYTLRALHSTTERIFNKQETERIGIGAELIRCNEVELEEYVPIDEDQGHSESASH